MLSATETKNKADSTEWGGALWGQSVSKGPSNKVTFEQRHVSRAIHVHIRRKSILGRGNSAKGMAWDAPGGSRKLLEKIPFQSMKC